MSNLPLALNIEFSICVLMYNYVVISLLYFAFKKKRPCTILLVLLLSNILSKYCNCPGIPEVDPGVVWLNSLK